MDINAILKLVQNNPDLARKALENAGIDDMQTLANVATAASRMPNIKQDQLTDLIGQSGISQAQLRSMMGGPMATGPDFTVDFDEFGQPIPKTGPASGVEAEARKVVSDAQQVSKEQNAGNWQQSGSEALQKAMMWLGTNPVGEEVLEGTMGGAMAGGALLGADQSLQRTALQTALAIAGGIGVGMIGRKFGARLGEMVHAAPLKNQSGPIAMLARLGGSETTMGGIQQQAKVATGDLKSAILDSKIQEMKYYRRADPVGFRQEYNIRPEEFDTFEKVQENIGRRGAVSVDDNLQVAASRLEKIRNKFDLAGQGNEDVGALLGKASGFVDSMRNQDNIEQITGKQVGKTLGRFIGDEVGIIGGLAVGSAAANQLGLKSNKDIQIEKLEELLKKNNISLK
jgi:hypothetical protein